MRQYDNTLRQRQAEATRTRILEAVRDLLVESPESLQIPEIAARAGVSEPTVYRHFPNRDALLDAAADAVSARSGAPPLPRTPEEIPVAAIAVARYFDRNASWIRAALSEPMARPLRMAGRKRRLDSLRKAAAPAVAHLPPAERTVALAAFGTIARGETWDCLTREFGLSSDDAGRAMSWILRALVDALADGRTRRRRRLVDEDTLARALNWPAGQPGTAAEK